MTINVDMTSISEDAWTGIAVFSIITDFADLSSLTTDSLFGSEENEFCSKLLKRLKVATLGVSVEHKTSEVKNTTFLVVVVVVDSEATEAGGDDKTADDLCFTVVS